MNKVEQLPNKQQIEHEAGMWLARLDSDQDLNRQQRVELSQWLLRSPAHRRELESLVDFWADNQLTELSLPLASIGAAKSVRASGYKTSVFLVAGILCVAIAAVLLQFINTPWKSTNGIYASAVGQQKLLHLADGSIARLNTDTQLKIMFGDGYRDIQLLQGEVHFEVEKLADRPFRVFAGNDLVQALGTAFTVYLKNNAADVLVTEGRVTLEAKTALAEPDKGGIKQAKVKPRLLLAGQGVVQDVNGKTRSLVAADEVQRRLSWRQGQLQFEGESLQEALAEFGRYSTKKMDIGDAELASLRIGGRFHIDKLDEFLASLEINFNIKIIKLSYNHIRLVKNDPKPNK